MRKLYLHVGVHRTGTTSTQRFLKDNFVPLLTKGYLYPFRVKRHDGQIRRLVKGEMSVHDFALDLERRADSQQFPINSIVISDEDMSLIQDFSLFAGLDDMFDVKVVVSLRRQDLWLESWYLQNIKWQWNPGLAHLSFAEFFKRRADFFWIDYATRFSHFEDVLGAGSVVAGVFEKGDMPQGPIQAAPQQHGKTDQMRHAYKPPRHQRPQPRQNQRKPPRHVRGGFWQTEGGGCIVHALFLTQSCQLCQLFRRRFTCPPVAAE